MASYPKWQAEDEAYRFYPGDKFRMDVRTAPELSGELDGRPGRPRRPARPSAAVMAGGHTVRETADIAWKKSTPTNCAIPRW